MEKLWAFLRSYETFSESVYRKSLSHKATITINPGDGIQGVETPEERKKTACHNNIRN